MMVGSRCDAVPAGARGRRTSAFSTPRRVSALVAAVAVAVAGLQLSSVVGGPIDSATRADAATAAPTVLYTEDFQNTTTPTAPTSLSAYTGTHGATYSADSYWLNIAYCNGFITNWNRTLTTTQVTNTYCGKNGSGVDDADYQAVLTKAYALGMLTGSSTADYKANYALSTNTSGGQPSAGGLMFKSDSPVTSTDLTGRFVDVSLDAAATNCSTTTTANNPLMKLYVTQGSTETAVTVVNVDPCATGTKTTVAGNTTATLPSWASDVTYGTYYGDAPVLITSSAPTGIAIRNSSTASSTGKGATTGGGTAGTANGNDGAIDNIRLVDVTPTLSKSFSPATIEAGSTSTLTLTVNNTSELAKKSGWSFTDTLPSGLSVAGTPNVSSTCGTATAASGGSTISVANGTLAANAATCKVSVNVTASTTGSYTNGAAQMTTLVGLNPPDDATLTVSAPKAASIKLTKTASGSPVKSGDTISYDFTVKNTGDYDLSDVALTDNLLSNVSCPRTTLAAGATMTCSADDYTVKQADVEAGKVVNTASVVATPPAGAGSAGSITSTDKATVNIAQTPQLKIVKTLLTGNPFKAGDQLTYGFTVTNTGNIQATGVGVNDSLLSGESCSPTTLAPGASASCTASAYTVTAADVTAGKVVNTATPTGTTVAGAATTDPSSTTSVETPIGTPPVATPNTATTRQNVPVALNPLTDQTHDTAGISGTGTTGALNPASVKLTGTGAAADGKSLTNADGTYVVDATTGVVTFTPAHNVTGTAASIGYQVTDSFGLIASSTITVTVTPIVPLASDDVASTSYLTPKTVAVLGNDAAGDTSVPLDPTSVVFSDGTKSLTNADGTYTINPTTGEVTFAPTAGFTGTATSVTYQVADTNGTLTTAKLTMTVAKPPAPSAADDAKSGPQGHTVNLTPAANDSAGGSATLQPSSVTITTAGTTGGLGKELVVQGKGTWTVAGDGTVTFAPLPAFAGGVSLDYSIADELGQTATAKITVTIDPLEPKAVADTAHAPYGTVSLIGDVLANDTPGDAVAAPIVPGSVVLKQADGTWATSLTVPGEGSYLVNTGGDVTFTPVAGFHGTATPVAYRVADSNGTTATSTLAMTIGNPPVATDNSATTAQNVPVTFPVAGDDSPGDDGAGVLGTIVATSVVFTDPLATDGGHTLLLPGKGTFSVDAATGDVTFTPVASYTGTTPQVDYRVTDSFGNTDTATLKVTVTPVTPVADDDANHAPYGTATVITDVLHNDAAGAVSAPLVPGSVVFSNGATSLTNADGTYTVDPVLGQVTFAPVAGFSGDAKPVTYRVSDANGTTVSATLTVTIGQPPVASPDVDSTPQNVDVTVAVLGNDKAGYDGSVSGGAGVQGTLTPSSVKFISASASPDGRTLITSEGGWTIDGTTGDVTFDPNPSYTGTTSPVDYAVTDSYGNTAVSTVAITVIAISPSATDDTTHTAYRTPVKTDVVSTDHAGASSSPLVRSTVQITTPGATDGGTKLVVPGQGTWKVDGNGDITFSPAAGFSGPASIAYQVSDANGTPATANLTVTVGVPPSADDEAGTTKQNENITLDLLTGDLPGDDGAHTSGTWVASSLVFASNGLTALTVSGQGKYTIDQASGKVTFDPIATFTGKADTVAYQVTDSYGSTAQANIDITVDPVTPVAYDDAKTTPYRTPTTLDVLGNDTEGAASAPLDPTSVTITTAGADADGKGLDSAWGTWTVDPVSGAITFAPKTGFTGDAVITYQVADANGTLTSAKVTVTVPAPPAPSVVDDTNHTPYLTPVKTSVLANDTAGGLAKLQKGSVTFADGTKSLTNADGTYTIDAAGDITFAPAAGFSGVATAVAYRVSDELGQTGTADLTVTVGAPPKATDNQGTTPQGVPVTIAELGDDTAGTNGAGGDGSLHKTSVVFTSASASPDGKKLVVANEGTWTIDATTGDATFTPLPAFTGTTTAVGYQVTDSFGNTATAKLKVDVAALVPTATNDANHGEYGAPVTTGVLGNDHGAASSAPLDPTSVTIVGAPGDGRTLVVAGQGTWTVSPTTGAITFTPDAGYHGTPDAITYRVSDSNGTPALAALSVTIGIPPAAVDDSASTPFRKPVTLSPLGNDSAGDDGAGVRVALDAATVVFTSAEATDSGRTLATAEGAWTIDATTGVVTFTPASTFSGPTASVPYRITDSYGHTATAYLTVTVGAAPAASDDSAATPQNTPVSLDPLANDRAGNNGEGLSGTLDPASVAFTATGASEAGKKLVLAGKGTFTVDPVTGKVTFTPEPAFTGDVPAVSYTVTDSFGNAVTARLHVTVTPVIPAAANDASAGGYGSAVKIDVLGNDRPGNDQTSLVPGTLVFTDPAAIDGGKALVVAGEGTWRINIDGTVTFTPADGFSGTTTPVAYQIADSNGELTAATITVTIAGGPAASDDQVKAKDGTTTVPVLSNDHAGAGCTLDASTVVLLGTDGNPVDATRSLVVDGQGTWTVNADGTLTFVGQDGFSGWTTRVTYRVSDSCGNTAQALARVWAPQASGGSLAYTGAAVGGAVGVSILLLVGGGLLLAVRGRRRGRRYA